MYNPLSINSYISKKSLKAYWVNTSGNVLITQTIMKARPTFKMIFDDLILMGSIFSSAKLETSFMEKHGDKELFGLLVNVGYLTIDQHEYGRYNLLRVPNQEVNEELKRIVATYTSLDDSTLQDMFEALLDNIMNLFELYLQKLLFQDIAFSSV